ncbi:major tail protein [Ureibacillus sp. FSL W8-0352]|uniref:major tail protein n=1 Tax=Ureibacillus sp. FSL W8-0352 TaxID=2954596 RepID=UPI0030FA1529
MGNKVSYGLTNVHYAVISKDEQGNYKYGKPKRVYGAVSLTLDPTGDSNNFYADNGVYFSRTANTGYEGTLSIARIPEEFRIDVLGEKLIDGGLLEKADAKPNDIALLFEVDGDVQQDRFVYYDVSVARPSQNANTTAESIEIEAQELSITVKPRTTDKAIRFVTGENTPKEIYDNFYNEVYEPKENQEAEQGE